MKSDVFDEVVEELSSKIRREDDFTIEDVLNKAKGSGRMMVAHALARKVQAGLLTKLRVFDPSVNRRVWVYRRTMPATGGKRKAT